MSNIFFQGQTDYVEKLNALALASEVAQIPANAAAAQNSANSASSSASNASSSAAAALASKNSAASTYENFNANYLGAKSTAPTVDNAGGTFVDGFTTYNTTGIGLVNLTILGARLSFNATGTSAGRGALFNGNAVVSFSAEL